MRKVLVMLVLCNGAAAGATKVDLNGAKATKGAASAAVRAAAKQVADPGMRIYGATFKLAAKDLSRNLTGKRALYFGHDVMFRANGDIKGWDPSAMKLNLQLETMRVRKIAPAAAVTSFYNAIKISSQQPNAIRPAVGKLMSKLRVGAKGSSVYALHWDNRDDTDYNAIMTVSKKTGRVDIVTSSPDI